MIEGSLRDAPLSDVFQIVVSGQKSGILTVVRNQSRARIYFDMGRLQYAHLSPGVHLGEIMVRMDLLTTQEVQEILARQQQENAGTPLGLMAIDFGLIDQDDLRQAVRAQIVEVLTEILLWRSGNFSFAERSGAASQVPTEHSLDAMMLLMEVIQKLDSWQDSTVNPNVIFEKSGDPTKFTLPKGGWEVLGYVDNKRSAASVAAEIDLPERQVYNILFELRERGLVTESLYQVDDPLVLVISPSSAMQRLMQLALRRARLRVDVTSDVQEGMRLLLEHHPQAIVVEDLGGEGWEFVKELRKLPGQGHIPVLVLGEEQDSGGLFSRFRRPKAEVLGRPFREIDFQQIVTRMVGRKSLS
ncbi:MAG: response regulator [Trueperaceae bacterium]|nr:response regulator [Trueperaceae bacterium]